MNFLAHTFLSCDDDHLLLGNFLADFLKNKEVLLLPESIQKGIFLHRKIDSFTDQHPLVKQGTRRLQARHRKYSPVIIDIFYDYLLANNWSRYTEESLEDFTQRIYKILSDNIALMPPRLQDRVANMIAHDWLMSYGQKDGLAYTFRRVQERVSKPEQFMEVMNSLDRDMDVLTVEFNAFFPEAIQFVREECFC